MIAPTTRQVRRRRAEFALIPILHDGGIEPLPATLEKLRRREPPTEGLHVRLRAVAIMAETDRQRDADTEHARGLHR